MSSLQVKAVCAVYHMRSSEFGSIGEDGVVPVGCLLLVLIGEGVVNSLTTTTGGDKDCLELSALVLLVESVCSLLFKGRFLVVVGVLKKADGAVLKLAIQPVVMAGGDDNGGLSFCCLEDSSSSPEDILWVGPHRPVLLLAASSRVWRSRRSSSPPPEVSDGWKLPNHWSVPKNWETVAMMKESMKEYSSSSLG